MANPNGQKGARFETELVEYLRKTGIVAERLPKTGQNDQGDGYAILANTGWAQYHVWEAKAERKIDIPGYLREIELERENFRTARRLTPDKVTGLVIVKARYKPIGQSYVVQTVDNYFRVPN